MAAPSSSNVKHTCTLVTEGFRSVLLLKMTGPVNVTMDTIVKSRCSVKGYDWEICLYPCFQPNDVSHSYPVLALELVLVGKPRTGSVTANLSGKIVHHTGDYHIYPIRAEQKNVPKEFRRPLDRSNPFYIGSVCISGGGSWKFPLTAECTITLFISGPEANAAIPVPPSDLPRHFGELLRSQAGADVTFSVSGESFAAHKSVLATPSPVFMAEFFGEMKEKDAKVVEILEMDAEVFKAMLHFIYTDAVLELDDDEKPAGEAMALAQHLIVAADRYGLDRLKVMCERRLALDMDVSTVASTLALAEQWNCSRLKAKCIEFITGGSREILSAVLATDGYKHLVEKSPLMTTELLMAAHGRKRSRSPDAN